MTNAQDSLPCWKYVRKRGANYMSFGYFQGQEAQALAYYKKLPESQPDPKIRKELEGLVAKLEKIVQEKKLRLTSRGKLFNTLPWCKPCFHNNPTISSKLQTWSVIPASIRLAAEFHCDRRDDPKPVTANPKKLSGRGTPTTGISPGRDIAPRSLLAGDKVRTSHHRQCRPGDSPPDTTSTPGQRPAVETTPVRRQSRKLNREPAI